jgi:hypothetical protein
MLLREAKVVFALFCHLKCSHSQLSVDISHEAMGMMEGRTTGLPPQSAPCLHVLFLIQDDRKHHALSHSMLVNYVLHIEAVRLKSLIKTSSRCRTNRDELILVFGHLNSAYCEGNNSQKPSLVPSCECWSRQHW